MLSQHLATVRAVAGWVHAGLPTDSYGLLSPCVLYARVATVTHPAVWSAVKQALLNRELRHLALTDEFTCLYNRRGFFAAAAQQLKLAARNSHSLLLLYCDVDNLKKINDSFGHQEGDLALIRTADALEKGFPGFRHSGSPRGR
jgi:PleD family two-component response regulator